MTAPSNTGLNERRTVAFSGAARAAFGVIWWMDAFLAWRPSFSAHYAGYLENASHGQPGWLHGWFAFWIAIVGAATPIFVWATRFVETLLALGLLLGIGRRWIYFLGAAFSLLLWATADGFSGPYVQGTANLGPALVYVLVFVALWLCDRVTGRTPYSVDYYIGRRWPRWQSFAEAAPPEIRERAPIALPWSEQGAAIAGIVVAIVLLLGGVQSALAVPPATPENAAAAVTPLSLVSPNADPEFRDARLPPLLGTGDTVSVTLEAKDATVRIANGVDFMAWTFGGMVPAPILHVRQGQTVMVTLVNHGMMAHSIDFHAAEFRRLPTIAASSPARRSSFRSSRACRERSSTTVERRPFSFTWATECTAR